MPIDIIKVSDEAARRALQHAEGHFLDLKSREIAPAKLTQSVSAFANSDGGELIVGVSEDKATGNNRWVGFADPEEANGHLQIFEKLFPLGQDFDYEVPLLRHAAGIGSLH